jgi:epoxyqueuosine reductase
LENNGLKAFIKEFAMELGFNAIGFSSVHPIPRELMTEWLDRNFQGEMSYLARNLEKRLDPRKVLPNAKSILSVALNYYHPGVLPYAERTRGVISRYARGTDYHFVLEKKLNELLRRLISLEPEVEGRLYVDTGPVMEKYWAVESGVGWLGKHTNVLSRSEGSWFFLGEILLTCELEPDEPARDYCGSCTRCIDACPTNAIIEPYLLDARRCISYSTIELKGDIPFGLRRPTGNLIFGCDICQEVCPWNRKAPESGVDDFLEQEGDYWLRELARLTPEQFNRSFRRNPLKRTKWRGLMRNVAVAMGNSGCDEMIPALLVLLQSEDSMIRRHAAWALQELEA